MKRAWLILAAVLGLVVLGGVALASIPAADGTINGCYRNTTGDLRVIDSTATCPNGWTALDWNQAGPPGVADARIVMNSVTVVPGQTGPTLSMDAWCDYENGEIATGGGGQTPVDQDPDVYWTLSATMPLQADGKPAGWVVQAERTGGPSTTVNSLTAFVICVRGSVN